MNRTHEKFIKVHTARLACEAGFAWFTRSYYVDAPAGVQEHFDVCSWDWNQNPPSTKYRPDVLLSRPTQSQLQRWLRERRGLLIWCVPADDDNWVGHILDRNTSLIVTTNAVVSYEMALERALIKSLESILIHSKRKYRR